jgi:hypothetical protein
MRPGSELLFTIHIRPDGLFEYRDKYGVQVVEEA